MLNQANLDQEHIKAKDLMLTFAQYGFKKTSMEDIGSAIGVTRQSIYKKFGTKEKCYEWTLNTYLSGMYSHIFITLEDDTGDSFQTLINVFDIFIGEAVGIVSKTHGAEILRDTLKTTYSSPEDWPLRFRARLADFLVRNDYAAKENARGMAFGLISAGKGLLLEESQRDEFLEHMTIILKGIINY